MRIIRQCDDGPGTKSAGALRRPAWSVINYVCGITVEVGGR